LGPRQIGKTTLAQFQLSLDPATTKYLDLERPSDLNKLTDPERYFELNRDYTLIIDEIQRVPALFPILRGEIDRDRRPGRFVLLGSSSDDIILLSTESLAGRVAYHELHPLSIQEILPVDYQKIWLCGGYPQAFLHSEDPENSFSWLDNLVRSHIERELSTRLLNILPHEMEALLRLLVSINGQLINYAQLSKIAHLSVPTLKKNLHVLERAYMIRILRPYHQNTTKRLTKSPKIYLRDVGILNYLAGHDTLDSVESDYHKGFSWEGHVIQQIFCMSKPSLQKYFYKTVAGAEMDLVMVKGSKPVATFEIKYSNSPKSTRSTTESINDLDCPFNYIITPSADRYPLRENLEVIGLHHLQNVLSELDLLVSQYSATSV
jgi:predicted AAA+ superfamily ATPase